MSATDSVDARLARVDAYERSIRPTLMNRVFKAIGPTRLFAVVYSRLGPPIDRLLQRLSKGKVFAEVYGFPALVLTTTGARSGQARESPLIYVREGRDFYVVGTNFGAEKHPAWTGNLTKTPTATIAVGSEVLSVRAERVEGEAFDRLWPRFRAVYAGYDRYRERIRTREVRMFRLQPM